MIDDPSKHHGNGFPPKRAGNGERCVVDRHRFLALIDVRDLGSGDQRSGRVIDLSLSRCCVDTVDPFPSGTLVHVRITGGNRVFESRGTVVGSHMGLWMNIAFMEMTSEHLSALEAWLAERDAAIDPAS
jgi:hypothetical protein